MLNRLAGEPGWSVTLRRRSGHYRIAAPDGRVYFASSTPSDHRAVRNLRAALRRMGAPVT